MLVALLLAVEVKSSFVSQNKIYLKNTSTGNFTQANIMNKFREPDDCGFGQANNCKLKQADINWILRRVEMKPKMRSLKWYRAMKSRMKKQTVIMMRN